MERISKSEFMLGAKIIASGVAAGLAAESAIFMSSPEDLAIRSVAALGRLIAAAGIGAGTIYLADEALTKPLSHKSDCPISGKFEEDVLVDQYGASPFGATQLTLPKHTCLDCGERGKRRFQVVNTSEGKLSVEIYYRQEPEGR